jgi:hypothetical protein
MKPWSCGAAAGAPPAATARRTSASTAPRLATLSANSAFVSRALPGL